MPAIDCPHCDGMGFPEDATGDKIICPQGERTSVPFVDEDAGDGASDHWS